MCGLLSGARVDFWWPPSWSAALLVSALLRQDLCSPHHVVALGPGVTKAQRQVDALRQVLPSAEVEESPR